MKRKYCSFFAVNVTPLSQNNRSSVTIAGLQNELVAWHNKKYTSDPLPKSSPLTCNLQVKAFYIHKVRDDKDADNISKPLWDSLNKCAYKDDKQIKYLETFKIDATDSSTFLVDVTAMDADDYDVLLDFVLNPDPTKQRLLYVCIEDLDGRKIRY